MLFWREQHKGKLSMDSALYRDPFLYSCRYGTTDARTDTVLQFDDVHHNPRRHFPKADAILSDYIADGVFRARSFLGL